MAAFPSSSTSAKQDLRGNILDYLLPAPGPFIVTRGRADSKIQRCYLYRTVPLLLASRTLFQMERAASVDQSLLRGFREARQASNVHRGLSLRSGRYSQKAS